LELRAYCGEHAGTLTEIARRVATIDVLQCFASVSRERQWVKPTITEKPVLKLDGARHAVLETQQGYVPNDVNLNQKRSSTSSPDPTWAGSRPIYVP